MIGIDLGMGHRNIQPGLFHAHAPARVYDGGVDVAGFHVRHVSAAPLPVRERIDLFDQFESGRDVLGVAAGRVGQHRNAVQPCAPRDVGNRNLPFELGVRQVLEGLRHRDAVVGELLLLVADARLTRQGDELVIVVKRSRHVRLV